LVVADRASLPDESPSSPAVKPLFTIPGHVVLAEVARGGMGIVYRAKQTEPPREVAIKMLLPHQLGSAGMRERFRQEARAIAALDHPAILPVHLVGEHDGMPFFTMKFATGGTLAQRKAQFEANWRAIAELMATLAEAVHFAHERGVLHRDLKPGNVLFDEQGRAYVSDFGLAKVVGADSDLTRSVDFLGTPHYVAPEIAAHSARAATISSDIYALGAILYELVAGRPPFEAEGVPALLKKISEEEPLPPSRANRLRQSGSPADPVPDSGARSPPPPLRSAISRDLEVICLKCLAKEPSRRYVSALDLASDLRRWLAGEPILARETSSLERIWLWSRRHRVTASLIGVVAVLLIALIVGLSVAAIHIADSRNVALRTVEALESEKINDLLAVGNTTEAVALAARRVRDNPDNWADAARLMWTLQRRRWAVPVRAPSRPFAPAGMNVVHRIVLARDNNQRLLALFVSTNLMVQDVISGTNLHTWSLPVPARQFTLAEKSDLIAMVGSDQRARFFEYLTGRMRPLEVAATSLIQMDAKGEWALVTAPDRSLQLADLRTGNLHTLVPHGTNHSASFFSGFIEEDQRLAFSDGERTMRVFDCERGIFTDRILRLPESETGLTISPDAKVFMTHTQEGTQFGDADTGRALPSRPEIGVSFRPGAFRPSSSQFYQGGNTFGLAIFDPLKGEIVKMPARGALLDGQCYADPADSLVAVHYNRFVGIYDGETGQPLCEPLPMKSLLATGPRFSGNLCATLDREGELIIWQMKTNRLEPTGLRHTAPIQHASFSPDGRRVITASHDGTARIWDARTGQPLVGPLAHADKVWSACFSSDGRRVATASWDATARLWDATTGAPVVPPLRAKAYVFHVEFSPNGAQLLTCGEDRTVRTYDANTGALLLELPEEGPVYWAAFSPNGARIVTRPMYANPKLWDAQSGKRILELSEPGSRQLIRGVVTRGEFSRDGSWLALGSPDRHATVWKLPEGKLYAVLSHVAVVRTASFSPDSRTILTTADDLTGQLWDLKTGKALSSPLSSPRSPWAPRNTGNSLRAGKIHPDGRRAITGGSDAAARLWDLRNGFPLGEPAELGGSVMHAEFSPDGEHLLLACFDGTAHILPLPPIVERAPEWLAPLAEALVGQRFDSQGAAESVSPAALWELVERLRQAPETDEAAAWARKVLDL
jgi:WD40 repeat protein/serine/threonine protein kinase